MRGGPECQWVRFATQGHLTVVAAGWCTDIVTGNGRADSEGSSRQPWPNFLWIVGAMGSTPTSVRRSLRLQRSSLEPHAERPIAALFAKKDPRI
jgi:hypothetical protein